MNINENAKFVIKYLVISLLLLPLMSEAQVNMSHYITLSVRNGQAIAIRLNAKADNTQVKIVSGDNEYSMVVNKSWTTRTAYQSGADTMTIYGDVRYFDCKGNDANITAIDVSNNADLRILYCYSNSINSLDVSALDKLFILDCSYNNIDTLDLSGKVRLKRLYCSGNRLKKLDITDCGRLHTIFCSSNDFSARELDNIYCSLPERLVSDSALLRPIYNSQSSNYDILMATNKNNAIQKGWRVVYRDSIDIPATNGIYVCGGNAETVNMERYIKMVVKRGQPININISADADETPVKMLLGDSDTTLVVGSNLIGSQQFVSSNDTIVIYGNVNYLSSKYNYTNLTDIDVSHNQLLEKLYCSNNALTSLDMSGCDKLTVLGCQANQLSSLSVEGCTSLSRFSCWGNNLTSLSVDGCLQLNQLYCSDNPLTTAVLDDVFCALPIKEQRDRAVVIPLTDNTDGNYSDMMATNTTNAIRKNWAVQFADNTDIPQTTGSFDCPSSGTLDVGANNIIVYPNPVSERLYIEGCSGSFSVEVYNGLGAKVMVHIDEADISLETLPRGIYIVKIIDGTTVCRKTIVKI